MKYIEYIIKKFQKVKYFFEILKIVFVRKGGMKEITFLIRG